MLFAQIGGVNTEVVLLDRFSAKLLVQCSAVQGIARAVGDCLGFSGSELYIKSDWPTFCPKFPIQLPLGTHYEGPRRTLKRGITFVPNRCDPALYCVSENAGKCVRTTRFLTPCVP